MKILLLTPQLPYPAISGGLIKSGQLIDYLNRHHDLEIACLLKGDDEQRLSEFKVSISPVRVHTEVLNIARTGVNFLRSLWHRIPLTIYRNRSARFARLVADLVKDKDVIFIDHYLMFQYVPKDFKGKVVVHQHNAEFLMWWRKGQLEQNSLLKQVLLFEANRIKQYELALCRGADSVLATCSDQVALIEAGADKDNFFETMHCADTEYFEAPSLSFEQTTEQLLFIGTLDWDANLDGLLWFGEKVWPVLKQKLPDVGLTIVGKCSPVLADKLHQALPGVEIAGFVDDLEPLYRAHRAFIAPLRFGSGVKVKVVNSLTRGLPTVTTSVGAEGIKVKDGEQIYICDEAQDFVDAIVTLMTRKQAWYRLSEQSRAWMKSHYSHEIEHKNLKRSLGL